MLSISGNHCWKIRRHTIQPVYGLGYTGISPNIWPPFVCSQGGCCCPFVIFKQTSPILEGSLLSNTNETIQLTRKINLRRVSHLCSYTEQRHEMDHGYLKFIHSEFPGIGLKVDAAFEHRGRSCTACIPLL